MNPYKLRKAPRKDLYWVVTIETGKKHSKDPIPKDKAKAQLRILESALEGSGKVTQEHLDKLKREQKITDRKIYSNKKELIKYMQSKGMTHTSQLESDNKLMKIRRNLIEEYERISREISKWEAIDDNDGDYIEEEEEEPEGSGRKKGGISWNPGIEDYTNTGLLASCEAARRDPNHAACQALKARIGDYKEPSGPVEAVGIPGLNPNPEMAIEDTGTNQPKPYFNGWNWVYPTSPEPIGIQMGGKKRGSGFQFRKEGAEYVIFDEETGQIIKRVNTPTEALHLLKLFRKQGLPKVEKVYEPMEGEEEEVQEGADVTADADEQYRTQLKKLLDALAPRGRINHQTLFQNLQPFLQQSNTGHAFLIRLFPYLMKVDPDASLYDLTEPMAKLINDLEYYLRTPIEKQKAYIQFMSGSGKKRKCKKCGLPVR